MQPHLCVYRKTALYSGSEERLGKFCALCHDQIRPLVTNTTRQ